MNILRPIALVVLWLMSSTSVLAAGKFPCHPAKEQSYWHIQCHHVHLPTSMCRTCNLRAPFPDGQFKECSSVFDLTSPSCHADLQAYVEANPCDTARAEVIGDFLSTGTNGARSSVDYFLYSICENCCDCIPMGRSLSDYDGLAAIHNDFINPKLWYEKRGNCPAHAVYDVCKVLPNVKHFSRIDDDSLSDAEVEAMPKACPQLESWLRSKDSTSWQEKADVNLIDGLQLFLRNLLYASDCGNKVTWSRCFDLENRQNHLKLPGNATLAPVTIVPPTTATTTTSTTTSTTTTMTTKTATSTPTAAMTPAIEEESPSPSSSPVDDIPLTTMTTAMTPAIEEESPSPSSSPLDDIPSTASPISSPNAEPSTAIVTPDETSTAIQSTDLYYSPYVTSEMDDTSGEPPSDFFPMISPDASSDPEPVPEGSQVGGTDDSNPACFPSDATVELASGEMTSMRELKIGDIVRVSKTEYSPVIIFSHRAENVMHSDFVTLTTMNPAISLTLTSGHMLHVRNRGIVAAGTVHVGDFIQLVESHSHQWIKVQRVARQVTKNGLFNPHTLQGDIVVSHIVTSCYTNALRLDQLLPSNEQQMQSSIVSIVHCLLAPIRALFHVGVLSERTVGMLWRDGII